MVCDQIEVDAKSYFDNLQTLDEDAGGQEQDGDQAKSLRDLDSNGIRFNLENNFRYRDESDNFFVAEDRGL